MKALTIWQPWASLIMIGAKPYEFRSWKPPASLVGQRLAIHAGARAVKRSEIWDLLQAWKEPLALRPCLHEHIARPFLEKVLDNPRLLTLSHVLGTAVVSWAERGDLCAEEFGIAAGNDSDRAGTFNWGWPLEDVIALEPPVEARGAQGLWEWRSAS